MGGCVVDLDSEDLQFPDRSSCSADKLFSLGKFPIAGLLAEQSHLRYSRGQQSTPALSCQIITRIREEVVLYQDSGDCVGVSGYYQVNGHYLCLGLHK